MPDGVSVPIVSQTEIEPIKTALSLMFALVTTTALTEPPPVPKPPGPGGSCPHGLHRERLILHAVAGCFGHHREAEQRHVSVGMDCVELVLLAKWTRAALAFALGPSSSLPNSGRASMPDDHRGRRSTYEHSKAAASQPGDEAGPYSWLQLEAMNERFRRAMERAITRGKQYLPDAEGR
jgi:hypothetical protein